MAFKFHALDHLADQAGVDIDHGIELHLGQIPPPGTGNLTTWTNGVPVTTSVTTPITFGDGRHRLIDNENNAAITGGNGNDTVFEIGTGAQVTLGNGNNLIVDFAGGATIKTGTGDQAIFLRGPANSVTIGDTAGGAADYSAVRDISGGAHITGGNGNMVVSVNGINNTITLGTGIDVVFTDAGDCRMDDDAAKTTAPVTANTIHLGNGTNHVFLGGGSGNTVTDGTGTDTIVGAHWGNDTFVINAAGGALSVRGFYELSNGDALDLSQILAGEPLAHDLSNLGDFVKVTSVTDPNFPWWTDTKLQITGLGGTANVTLLNTGTVTLAQLEIKSLILPAH